MALQDQLNTIVCGAEGVIGSGRLGCPIDPENIKHLIATDGSYFSEDVLRAAVRSMQKQGKLVPLLDAYDVTWENEENQIETSASLGLESKGRSGNYKLTTMFANGMFFQRVLESMEGQNRWSIYLVDEEDNIFGTLGKNGEFKGLKTSRFSVNPYKFKSGAEGGKTSVTMQFSRPKEFNAALGVVTSEKLDFLPSDLDGINQVGLGVSGLIDAATTIVVKTVLEKDNNTFVDGLNADGSDFLVKVGGTPATVSAATADAEAKTYTLTISAPLAVDQVVEVLLYDSSGNSRVIEVGAVPDEILYQSKEVTGVVTA